MKTHYILIMIFLSALSCVDTTKKKAEEEPLLPLTHFVVDPFWPKPLPNNWLLGQVTGVAVDSKDNIWIIHRSARLKTAAGEDEVEPSVLPEEFPFTPAPSVIQFDPEGNVLQAWGEPGEGYEWLESEHGIFIDFEDNVWIGGASTINDNHVLKFRPDGTFLLQIGRSGKTGGSNNTMFLGRPTDFDVDPVEKEVYISDGYYNRRVIVFDAYTGEYKRHWGAYGNKPDDSYKKPLDLKVALPQQFETVHGVSVSDDGLVYVADRGNNRIQVFRKNGEFIFEAFIAKDSPGHGSAWDIDFSHDPEQKYLYLADGTNQRVWILQRKDLQVVTYFGRIGRYAGQFIWLHNVAVDSKGDIFTTEVRTGKRVQKFVYQGNL